jgi:hypothetical protein
MLRLCSRKFTLLNRVPFGKFNRVNALIRGGLSAMRDVAFLVRLPEGATGTQRSRHLLEGIGPVFRYIPAFSLASHQAR